MHEIVMVSPSHYVILLLVLSHLDHPSRYYDHCEIPPNLGELIYVYMYNKLTAEELKKFPIVGV
jgi:hypothetical protein